MELLQPGNIIKLEIGMRVYANIPEYAIFSERRFSTYPVKRAITIGEQFSNPNLTREAVIEEIQKHPYFFLGNNLSYSDINSFPDRIHFDFETHKYDTSIFAGKYEVCNCLYDGASVVDINTKGWHVFCQKLSDPSTQVEFYQTGVFTAMIREIKPIA